MLFKNIVLGQYLPVKSPIHRLDPRTKFAAVIAVARHKGSEGISAFQGLAKENFPLALLMFFFLVSVKVQINGFTRTE